MSSSHHWEQNFGTTLGSAIGVHLQPRVSHTAPRPLSFSPTPYVSPLGAPNASEHRGSTSRMMIRTDLRPRTRKIAKIIDQDKRPSGSSPANLPTTFSPGGTQPESTTKERSLESSDIRSMSYYQNLPIKLEDLFSDDSSVEDEIGLSDTRPTQSECSSEVVKKAEGFHRKWLLRKGMKRMVWNVLEQREATTAALLHHNRQTKQSFLQRWKKKLAMAERRKILVETFSWWRKRTIMRKKLCDTSVRKNQQVLAHCLHVWRTRLTEASQLKTALQHHHMKLRHKVIVVWKAELEKARSMKRVSMQRAETFYRAKAIEKGFLVWRQWMVHRSERQERAISLVQRAQMRGVVQRWKNYTNSKKQLRELEESFKETKTRKAVRNTLSVWKESWRLRQKSSLAQHVHLLHIKRRALQAWRLYIYNCTLKKLCEAYLNEKITALLQASFDHWVCQTASLVGESLLSSRVSVAFRSVLLRKAFSGWLATSRISKGLGRLREMQERGIANKFFQIWRSTWLRIKELETSLKIMERWRTKKLFCKWRDRLHHRKLEMTTVQKQNLYSLRSAFTFWRAECSRHIALHAFVTTRNRTLLRTSLRKWKMVAKTKAEMTKTQISVQFHNNGVLRRCFSNWRRYTKESEAETSSQIEALQSHIQRLRLESSLRCWRRQLQCLETTRRHLSECKHLLLLGCLTSWREFTVSSNQHASHLFFTKLQQALSKDPQTSTTMADTSLANVSYNLGLTETPTHDQEVDCHHTSITSPFQNPSSGHLSPEVQQQVATTTHLEGSHYQRSSPDGIHIHSTPHPTTELHDLSYRIQQNLASSSLTLSQLRPLPSSVFGSNTNNSNNNPVMVQTPVKPVQRRLFGEGEVSLSEAEEGQEPYTVTVSPDNTVSFPPSIHSSPSQMCNCLNPVTLQQIQTVQHKLDELSPSFQSSRSFALAPETSTKPCPETEDVTGDYPILPPPSDFCSPEDNEIPPLMSEEGSLFDTASSSSFTATLSLTASNQMMNSTTASTQSGMPLPLQQLSSTLKYMRLYPCSRVFRIWKHHTIKKRNLKETSEVARKHRRMKRLKIAFCTWRDLSLKLSKLGDLEQEFRTKASNKILRNCVATWREVSQRRQVDEESEMKAVEFHTLACMRKHFLYWKQAYCGLMESQSNQCQQAERLVISLKCSFQHWKRLTTRKKVVRKFLRRWKQTATARRREKQAESLRQYWQLSNAWGKWRCEYVRETTVTSLLQRDSTEILRQVLTSWRSYTVSSRC